MPLIGAPHDHPPARLMARSGTGTQASTDVTRRALHRLMSTGNYLICGITKVVARYHVATVDVIMKSKIYVSYQR